MVKDGETLDILAGSLNTSLNFKTELFSEVRYLFHKSNNTPCMFLKVSAK
jgi:hypothetical protein